MRKNDSETKNNLKYNSSSYDATLEITPKMEKEKYVLAKRNFSAQFYKKKDANKMKYNSRNKNSKYHHQKTDSLIQNQEIKSNNTLKLEKINSIAEQDLFNKTLNISHSNYKLKKIGFIENTSNEAQYVHRSKMDRFLNKNINNNYGKKINIKSHERTFDISFNLLLNKVILIF